MAGRLLFVILMYSFHEILVQALLPPKVIVNSPVISETDSVTLNCQTPSSVAVSQCYFYTVGGETSRSFSCLQRLTGADLLRMSHQTSSAEVKVRCFYTVKYGAIDSPSPHSDSSSITIQNIVEGQSSMTSTKSALSITTDLNTERPHASTVVTHVKPASDLVREERTRGGMQTEPTSTMITGPTVRKSRASTPVTCLKQTSGTSSDTSTSFSTLTTSAKPASETWTWKLVLGVACFGGVIFLGLALFCTQTSKERCSSKRTQASVTDDLTCMRNLKHGELLSAGNDEAYSVITSLPAADCPDGSEKLERKESQNKDSDIYHVYSIISEEASPSALKDMVYSTLQPY